MGRALPPPFAVAAPDPQVATPALSDRTGTVVLLLGGITLIVGGLASGGGGTRIALCALGTALVVLAVVVTRLKGALRIGPTGIEASLRAADEERLVEQSRALRDTLDAIGARPPSGVLGRPLAR